MGYDMYSYEVDNYGYDSHELMKEEYFNTEGNEGMKALQEASQMPLFWNWLEALIKENVDCGSSIAYEIAEWAPNLSKQRIAAVANDKDEFWDLVQEDNEWRESLRF